MQAGEEEYVCMSTYSDGRWHRAVSRAHLFLAAVRRWLDANSVLSAFASLCPGNSIVDPEEMI